MREWLTIHSRNSSPRVTFFCRTLVTNNIFVYSLRERSHIMSSCRGKGVWQMMLLIKSAIFPIQVDDRERGVKKLEDVICECSLNHLANNELPHELVFMKLSIFWTFTQNVSNMIVVQYYFLLAVTGFYQLQLYISRPIIYNIFPKH